MILFGIVNPLASFIPKPNDEKLLLVYIAILAVAIVVIISTQTMLLSIIRRIDSLDSRERIMEKDEKMLIDERKEVDVLRVRYDKLVAEAQQSILIYRQLVDDEKSRMEQAKKNSNQASETASG